MDLIDRAEVKKQYPIMENDFGMVVNESLHKELDKILTIDAIPLSVIEEIKAEIENYYLDCDFSVYDKDENCKKCNDNVFNSIRNIIDRKIKEIQP